MNMKYMYSTDDKSYHICKNGFQASRLTRNPFYILITLLIVTFLFLFNTTEVFAKTETLKGVTDFEVYPDDSMGENYNRLSFNVPYDNCEVEIQRSVGNKKSFKSYDIMNCYEGNESYSDYVEAGIPYYYRVRVISYTTEEEISDYWGYTYTESIKHKGKSKFSKTKRCISALDSPEFTNIIAENNKTITLYWNDVTGAAGYRIFRRKGKTGEYKLIKTLGSEKAKCKDYTTCYYNSNKYSDKGLILGATYYYKICAYTKYKSQKYSQTLSSPKKATVTINVPKIVGGSSLSPGTNTIRWKRVSKADGYIIYCSKTESGGFKKIKTIKSNTRTAYTHKGLTNGKYYFYKVAAYKKTKKGNLISKSESYGKPCSYYGFYNEDYYSKTQRIFGKNYYKNYSSAAEAEAHMTTIAINVWDINSSGVKYSKVAYLTVNKNIAPTVQQMFKEIFESSERIPIHAIGGYRFCDGRSEHNEGLAIDINPEENYMIKNGVIQAGSFWDPSRSPYSIPLKCEFVRIMNKYGFHRGFWRNSKDYMHFSYFGT